MSDQWTTVTNKKKYNKFTCKCDKNIHYDYCELKIHSIRVLAGVSKVIFKSTFLSSFVSPIFTDLTVKLSNEDIENKILIASKSDDINIKKSVQFIRDITWITKIIEHYYSTNGMSNTRASIQMIEYWINYINVYNTSSLFINEFKRRLELTKSYIDNNSVRSNTLGAFLPKTNIELDFEPMPINSDTRIDTKIDTRNQIRNQKTFVSHKSSEPIISNEPIRKIDENIWSSVVKKTADKVIEKKAPINRVILSEEEYKLKQIEGEIPQGIWCVFIIWVRFCFTDNYDDIINIFNIDYQKGRVKRVLLKLVHPDHITFSLKEKANIIGQELQSRIEQFDVYFKDADRNIINIPGWNETFNYISKTSLSHTSFNKTAFSTDIENNIIKIVKRNINKKHFTDIVSAIDSIIRWSAIYKNGAKNGANKDIKHIINDVLELVEHKKDIIPQSIIDYIFGNCNNDKWNPNDIISAVPCLKHKFNNINENTFEAYFGKNILCITSPMLREFILRMIRGNFGTNGSSNELIDYAYVIGVKHNYINPDNSNDKYKHMIIYILVRFSFLAIYEKCGGDPYTIDKRSTTLSFAKIKSSLWEETPFQQYILEYVKYQNQQKINMIFGKIRNIFKKYHLERINYIVKCFCMKLLRLRNLKHRNNKIFNAGLYRIKNNINTISQNDDLEDWERDEFVETSIILINRKMTDIVLRNNDITHKYVSHYEVGVIAGNQKLSDLSKITDNRRKAHQSQSAKYVANSLYMKECRNAENEGINLPIFDSDKEFNKALNIQKTSYAKNMMKRLDKNQFIADLLNVSLDELPSLYENINTLDKYSKWILNTITDDFINNMNEKRINRLRSNGWDNFKLYETNVPNSNPPINFWIKYNTELYSILNKRMKQRNIMVKGLNFFNRLKGNKKIESNEDIERFYINLKSISNNIIRPNNFDTFTKSYSNSDLAPTLNDPSDESKVRSYVRQSEKYDGKTRLDYIRSLATITKI